jgi:hypothetical protein
MDGVVIEEAVGPGVDLGAVLVIRVERAVRPKRM